MNNNKNNNKETLESFIFKSILLFPLIGISLPIVNGDFKNLGEIFSKKYWIELFILYPIIILFIIYFEFINPRKTLVIDYDHEVIRVIIQVLLIPVLMALMVIVGLLNWYITIRIIIIVLLLLLLIINIYMMISKITIYKNKNILIVNKTIKYYKKATINDILITKNYSKKKSIINIVINNQDNIYIVKTKQLDKYCDKLKQFIKNTELNNM